MTTLYAIWMHAKIARGGQPQTAAGIFFYIVKAYMLRNTGRCRYCRLFGAHTHQGDPRDRLWVQTVDNGGLAALTAGQTTTEWLRGRSLPMPRPSRTFGVCILCSAKSYTLTLCVFIRRWHTLCPAQVLREYTHIGRAGRGRSGKVSRTMQCG